MRDQEPVQHGGAAQEPKPGKGIPGGGSEGDAGHGHGQGDEGGIADPAEERRLREQDAEIIERGAFRDEGERSGEELVARPQGNGHDLTDRVKSEESEKEEREITEGDAKRRPAVNW